MDDIHGYDVVHDSGVLFDAVGHGTHVAGTIGAQGNDSFGVIGASQDVSIMTLKADLDTGGFTTVATIEAIKYADKMGAEIVNMSLGGYSQDTLVRDAMAASSALFVCAAGNDANDNDSMPFLSAGEPLPNIIAVAATAADDSMASFSNYGATTVDLAAPGQDIVSTFPRPDTTAVFTDDFDHLGGWDTSDYWQKPWTMTDARFASAKTGLGQASPRPTEWAWATLKNPVDVGGSTAPAVGLGSIPRWFRTTTTSTCGSVPTTATVATCGSSRRAAAGGSTGPSRRPAPRRLEVPPRLRVRDRYGQECEARCGVR